MLQTRCNWWRLTWLLVVVCLASTASAQTPIQTPVPADLAVRWTHDGINTTEFLLTVDGTRFSLGLPIPVAEVYTVAAPTAARMALTPGTHQLTLIAKGDGGESASDPLSVVVTIGAPSTATGFSLTLTQSVAK